MGNKARWSFSALENLTVATYQSSVFETQNLFYIKNIWWFLIAQELEVEALYNLPSSNLGPQPLL